MPDLDAPDLPDLINTLRGSVSFDALAKAVDNQVGAQTIQRMGDRNRPYNVPVEPGTLIKTAEAINRLCPEKTTPWALWIAHGESFARTHGLWGRPPAGAVDSLPLLFAGWHTLQPASFSTLNRVGQALLAAQRAGADADRITALETKVAALETALAEARAPKPRRRT